MEPEEATTTTLSDLWSWLDEPEPTAELEEIDPATVTVVMVVHNAEPWLPRQLLSLARLSPAPGRIIAVDNGSSDQSPALLQRALAEGVIQEVVAGEADFGFGEAVARGLGDSEPEWIWLLHDDSAPMPDALTELLLGVKEREADIVVPKLLQPRRRNYPETLSEIGQSIAPSGRRVPLVEDGDIDQLQDFPETVLGGSTAGLLIRGQVWRELGGLSPELPLYRDGIDFGWRAAASGYKTTTWPAAALTHRQAGRLGERAPSLAKHAHEIDRLAALRLVAARGGRSRFALLAGSCWRALGFLVAKSPSMAAAELRAVNQFWATPTKTASLASRPAGQTDVTPLLPAKHWTMRNAFDRFGSGVTERYRDLTSGESDTSIDELTGEDFANVASQKKRRISPFLVLFLGLLIAGAVAGRSLLGTAGIAGGGLLAAPANLGLAWQGYLSPNLGVLGANAPWLGFAAFFSTFSFASPPWLAFAALLLAPALAALSAHLLLRRLGFAVLPAAVSAGVWAGATILLGLVAAGDISGMVLAVAGPMLGRSIHSVVVDQTSGAERLRAPAGAAFWLLICASAWPLLLIMGIVAGVVWVLRDRSRWVDLLIGLGLPIAFLAPWFPTLLRWPGRILTGADPLAWPDYPPASIATLVGRIMPSGLPLWANICFFGVLALVACYSLFRLPRPTDRLPIVAGIAVPLIAGAALSRVALAVNGGLARPLLSGWALLVVAALLVPILFRQYDSEVEEEAQPNPERRYLLGALAAVVLLATTVWAVVGFAGLVRQTPSVLPGYVRDAVASARDSRVLLVELVSQDSLRWNVVSSSQPRWGTGERGPAGPFAEDFAALVQSLSSGQAPEDLATKLASLGVSHVWMKGFDAERLTAIGHAAGLTRANAGENEVVWTVVGQASMVRLVDNQTSTPVVDRQIAASDKERYLTIAAPDDPRWQVKIGDQQLETAPDRPPVTFVVPAGVSGQLSYGLRPNLGALGWQIVVVLLLIGLALPTLGGTAAARRELR